MMKHAPPLARTGSAAAGAAAGAAGAAGGRPSPDDPIGVFDSGIGGLTVLRALLEHIPRERFIYLGDTAKVPYGSKSPATVTRYAMENTLFLLQRGVKAVVVACNTVSSTCLDQLARHFRAPVVGVIEPAVREAVRRTARRRIAVIGTAGTIASGAYERALHALDPGLTVETIACPLFVPLVEEGFADHAIAELAVREYLQPLKRTPPDCLILACTHYPFMRAAIGAFLGPEVQLIDSGPATAEAVARLLDETRLLAAAPPAPQAPPPPAGAPVRPQISYFLSDLQPRFREIGERFLGRPVDGVEVVSI
jgi:glutamate racemase